MPLYLGNEKISRVTILYDGSGATSGTDTSDATLTTGAQMLSPYTAYSNGKKYTGTIATVDAPTPSVSVSDAGLITASVSNPKGYQSNATNTSVTKQLTTQGAKTITPSDASQTAVDSGVYTTGVVTVNAVPTETKSVTSNGTYNPTSGKYFSSVTVNVPAEEFNTQTKTVTPTESTQTVSPDNGYDGLSTVTVNPISSTYVGSAVPTKGATTITPNSNSQTAISFGTYATGDVIVSAVPTETKSITANGTYTPSDGKYFSSVSVSVVGDTFDTQEKTVTPTESEQVIGPDAGYDGLSSVTVGAISSTYVGSGITRKSAATITPSESVQTIAANQYLTGVQTISAIPSDYVGSDVTRKSAATITPAESEQVIPSGQYLEGTQTISAIPSNYVGSGVTTKGTTTIMPSTSEQTAVSAGTYVTGDVKVAAMTNGELNAPTVNASGLVMASVATSGYLSDTATKTLQLNTKGATTITPSTSAQTAIASGTYATGDITVSAMPTGALSTPTINESTGLVTAGVSSSGYLDTSKTSTLQLTTKTAETFTPTTTNQTINAGQYLTGVQTIQGDVNLIPANIASGVSIFGVTGTHQGGGGTDTSDATATESDIVNGKTAYINGGKVTGTLVVQNYYTGSAAPESTTGEDGDLYFKVVR